MATVPIVHCSKTCCYAPWWPPAYADECNYLFGGTKLDPPQANILVAIGGKTFELVIPAALAPYAIEGRELLQHRSSLYDLCRLIMDFCSDQIVAFNRQEESLMSFLSYWRINVYFSNGKFALDQPTRSSPTNLGSYQGIEYYDTDLPWYDWRAIKVLERESIANFQVSVDGNIFGCYAPYEYFQGYPDYCVFLDEVRAWKRITESSATADGIPRLVGLVYSKIEPNRLRGVLYDWREPSKATPTLNQVDIDRVSLRQRRAWLQQIEHDILSLHAHGASWTREQCEVDPTVRITIAASGEAYLRFIHFGGLKRNRHGYHFGPHQRADYRALAQIQSFLHLKPVVVHARAAASQSFRFLDLPSDVRNMVYEILLTCPGYITWLWGYRHQVDALRARSELLPENALLSINRQVRFESLSFLLSRNTVLMNALLLTTFLRTGVSDNFYGQTVGSFLRRVTVTLTIGASDDLQSWKEQSKGIMELRKYCSSLTCVKVVLFDVKAWSKEGYTAHQTNFETLPSIRLTKESDYDDLIKSCFKQSGFTDDVYTI